MILITNATSFAGRGIVRGLATNGCKVRCLLQPSRRALGLPPGLSLSIVSASMGDLPALRTSLQDISAVVHLIGEDELDSQRTLDSHPQETANLIAAMQEADVRRLIYVSRLGSEPASAYPLFRIRGEVEMLLRDSELEWTILQPSITYGPEDAFINVIAMLAKAIPFALPIPDVGNSCFQPLWIGDLTMCVASTLDQDRLIGHTIPLGGPEHFTFEQLVAQVLGVIALRKRTIRFRLPLMRGMSEVFHLLLPRNPVPLWMLDIITLGSAGDLTTIPRHFGFEPCRFAECLEYLRDKRPWRRDILRFAFRLNQGMA